VFSLETERLRIRDVGSTGEAEVAFLASVLVDDDFASRVGVGETDPGAAR